MYMRTLHFSSRTIFSASTILFLLCYRTARDLAKLTLQDVSEPQPVLLQHSLYISFACIDAYNDSNSCLPA